MYVPDGKWDVYVIHPILTPGYFVQADVIYFEADQLIESP